MEHFTVTLTAAAQSIRDALGGDAATQNIVKGDRGFRQLSFQADDGNSNDAFGGGPGVTTSDYGFVLITPPTAGPELPVVFGPFEAGPLKLSGIYLVGTAGEKVHVTGIPF